MEQIPEPGGGYTVLGLLGGILTFLAALLALVVRWALAFIWRREFGRDRSRNPDGE